MHRFPGVRLSWVQSLWRTFEASLLFGIVGMPLGAMIFLGGCGIIEGRPFSGFRIFGHPDLAVALTAFFGGIPAVATGAIAWILRRKVRSFPRFAVSMLMIGAGVTAVYLSIVAIAIGGFRWGMEILCLIAYVSATGGITAFCCSFLLLKPAPR